MPSTFAKVQTLSDSRFLFLKFNNIYFSQAKQCKSLNYTHNKVGQSCYSTSHIIQENDVFTSENRPLVRLNRCLRPLTRKLADSAILEGKVLVNGVVANVGMKITKHDRVAVDGIPIDVTVPAKNQIFSPFELYEKRLLGDRKDSTTHLYLKIWKPAGYRSSLRRKDPNSMIELLERDLPLDDIKSLFVIDELDKDTSGLLVLSTDRRIFDAVHAQKHSLESIYAILSENYSNSVNVDRHINGMVSLKEGDQLLDSENRIVKLKEPVRNVRAVLRNKMVISDIERFGRFSYGGIDLSGLPSPGCSKYLNDKEIAHLLYWTERKYEKD